MNFRIISSPHLHDNSRVSTIMLQVLAALVPGVLVAYWFFGAGVLIQLGIAISTTLSCEALMLKLRKRPLLPFLSDGSAIVTACLLALCIPPLSPWWLVVIGCAFAIIIAKHLYGGLGYNPFNPAMIGYVVLLISFPLEMTRWQTPIPLLAETLNIMQIWQLIFTGELPYELALDAFTSATPLDHFKTGVGLGQTSTTLFANPLYGQIAGVGWEWIGAAFAAGGLWLMYKKVIGWQIPIAMLLTIACLALLFQLIAPEQHLGIGFHWFAGGTMLGAFFIATDPVTASTTPRGRIFYGMGIGAITFIIRIWGGYPDGIAFGVLLMNMAVPTLDYYTQPRVLGETGK